MTTTASEFWKRLSTVSLVPDEQLAELQRQFDEMPSATDDGKWIAEQLVSGKVLSTYQARILLGDGPVRFDYGPYRVINQYSHGFRAGMYRAVHRPSRHAVDLDLVPTAAVNQHEIEIHCQAQHANLAGCYESLANDREQTPVILERVSGAMLTDVVGKKRLSVAAACRVVFQVAESVTALHAVGLAHGQLCPAAILVASPTQVKVLRRPARHVRNGQHQDQIAHALNQVCTDFQPPESAAAQLGDSAFAGDVYTLGQILLYLIVGQPVREESPVLNGIPAPLRTTIAAMISREPDKRLSHAGVVAAVLEDLVKSTLTESGEALAADKANPTFVAYSSYLQQQSTAVNLGFSVTDPASVLPLPLQSDAEVDIEANSTPRSEMLRQRRRSARSKEWIMGAVAALVVVTVGFLISRSLRMVAVDEHDPEISDATAEMREENSLPTDSTALVTTVTSTTVTSTTVTSSTDAYVEDDGNSLWASPTKGDAIELSYTPPGCQLFVHLRPASILSHPEGSRCLAALGPLFDAQRVAWETAIGLPLADIDELLLAHLPRDAQQPAAVWVVRPAAGKGMPSRWANAHKSAVDGQDLYVDGVQGLWAVSRDETPEDQSPADQVFVIGIESAVRKAIEAQGAPVLLRRNLEQLRDSSDREQHVTFLFAPNFLRAEVDKVLSPQLNDLFSYVANYLGDETRGCLFSLHLEENQFFGEVRLATDNPAGPSGSADLLRQQIKRIPAAMESAIAGLATLDPYWRRLALRSVRMTDFLCQHTRVGVEQRHVVANFSLPAAAAHNLLLTVELTTAAVAAAPTNEPATPLPVTLDDVLRTRISLDIPQQSIEFALNDLASLVNARVDDASIKLLIGIDGPSFQAEGITRNQQIRGFRRDNATVADLLTGLAMTANPVTTVTAPHETDQKLVWVILPEPTAGGARIILITTRKAAQQNGYSLPAAFREK